VSAAGIVSDPRTGLDGSERKYLRGLAHSLNPLVHVGRSGLTDAVIEATRRALDEHELIKVKIAADRDERERIAEAIRTRCDAELAGSVGTIAILYRQQPDPERRRIELPPRRQ
jgi:RNA-binding protein